MTQAKIRAPAERSLPSPTALMFTFMLAATIGGFGWLTSALTDPAALPIRKVMVEGEFTHLVPDVLQEAVASSVNAGFFALDVTRIRRHLLDEPWIREATIRRVWPDALHVRVVEQTPVARWGRLAMLNEVGDIFAPSVDLIPTDLVQLNGPIGSEVEVLRKYYFLSGELAAVGIDIAVLQLSARYAWTLTTAGGKNIVLGRRELGQRLQRFLFGYQHGLSKAWPSVGHVDLRYTNGFAVGQRTPQADNG